MNSEKRPEGQPVLGRCKVIQTGHTGEHARTTYCDEWEPEPSDPQYVEKIQRTDEPVPTDSMGDPLIEAMLKNPKGGSYSPPAKLEAVSEAPTAALDLKERIRDAAERAAKWTLECNQFQIDTINSIIKQFTPLVAQEIARVRAEAARASVAPAAPFSELLDSLDALRDQYETSLREGRMPHSASVVFKLAISELSEIVTRFRVAAPSVAPAAIQDALKRGMLLVESAFAHVSHGGPTRADAEKWLKEARAALDEKTGGEKQ